MHSKEKKYDSWKSKNIIYEPDTAIKKSQVHQWSLKFRFTSFIYRNTFLN